MTASKAVDGYDDDHEDAAREERGCSPHIYDFDAAGVARCAQCGKEMPPFCECDGVDASGEAPGHAPWCAANQVFRGKKPTVQP